MRSSSVGESGPFAGALAASLVSVARRVVVRDRVPPPVRPRPSRELVLARPSPVLVVRLRLVSVATADSFFRVLDVRGRVYAGGRPKAVRRMLVSVPHS